MAYVSFLDDASKLTEEMLFARGVVTDSKGETIFKVSDYFQKRKIPMGNILACATDGAAAMVGRYGDFIAYLKRNFLICFAYTGWFIQIYLQKILSGHLKHATVEKVVNKSNPLKQGWAIVLARGSHRNQSSFTQLKMQAHLAFKVYQ